MEIGKSKLPECEEWLAELLTPEAPPPPEFLSHSGTKVGSLLSMGSDAHPQRILRA